MDHYVSSLVGAISTVNTDLNFFFFFKGVDRSDDKFKVLCKCRKCLCVYVFYEFVSGLILWIFENLCFDDLCAE